MKDIQREAEGRFAQPHESQSSIPIAKNEGLEASPDTSGQNRSEPVKAGQSRTRPVVTVAPSDDDYIFTAQGASIYSGKKSEGNQANVVGERQFRRVCDKEEGSILKCVWLRVGNQKPQWYIGKQSLDHFLSLARQSNALKSESPDASGQSRTVPDSSDEPPGNLEEQTSSKEVQTLRNKLEIKSLEIEMKDKIIEQQMTLRQKDMDKVAELGITIGELQEKNTQLQLSTGGDKVGSKRTIDISTPGETLGNQEGSPQSAGEQRSHEVNNGTETNRADAH